ncbi:MAG: IS66 family transposase [Deltaproteobacteria bacterium]|nr:MAG: IS66 family transposase [Deltaproteobacteria bacterium]
MIAVASDNTCGEQQVSSVSKELDLERLVLENRVLNCEKNYYKSLHERAKAREELRKQEVQQLNARIRYLEQKLYGRKSEKKTSSEKNTSTSSSNDDTSKRERGQQPGSPGHGRRDYSHLPVEETVYKLDEAVCPKCGCPLHEDPLLDTDDSETIEIEVKAYRRKAKRKKYKKACQCDGVPGIITAPGPAKLIDKGKLGISVWVHLLLEKYLYQRPINRLLELFKDIEFDAAAGTIGGGLKKLPPLFEPVLKEIIRKNQTERHLHADETRWLVFEFIDGKKSYRWYMWVFVSKQTVVYVLDPSRATSVIEKHLNVAGVLILSVDRYSSYKSFAKDRENVILAFCWTHVRRDFLTSAKGFDELHAWGMGWVESIGNIFHLNNLRVKHEVDSLEFAQADQLLREALDRMEQQFELELTEADLHPERAKRLNSIKEHWEGLRVFVGHPWIPMDNSEAERKMYTAALGRKNYYGSGSVWSGHFTASLFSIFQTLKLWKINPRKWLTQYLQACAENRGQSPPDLTCFLPWTMSKEQLARLHYPEPS